MLTQISEEKMSEKPAPNKWSKKEIIGPLQRPRLPPHRRVGHRAARHHRVANPARPHAAVRSRDGVACPPASGPTQAVKRLRGRVSAGRLGPRAPQRDVIPESRRTRTPQPDFGAALSFDVSRMRGLLRTDAGEQATPPREWERGLHSPITPRGRRLVTFCLFASAVRSHMQAAGRRVRIV